jgi:hypothetical protein
MISIPVLTQIACFDPDRMAAGWITKKSWSSDDPLGPPSWITEAFSYRGEQVVVVHRGYSVCVR